MIVCTSYQEERHIVQNEGKKLCIMIFFVELVYFKPYYVTSNPLYLLQNNNVEGTTHEIFRNIILQTDGLSVNFQTIKYTFLNVQLHSDEDNEL